MSLAHPLPATTPTIPRKRTTSFCCSDSNTRPTKTARTEMSTTLRRTDSFLCLSDMQRRSTSSSTSFTASPNRSRERRKAVGIVDRAVSMTAAKSHVALPTPSPSRVAPTPPKPQPQPQPQPHLRNGSNTSFRISSPLSPNRTVYPGRPVFPRSKHEPDLYRQAITTRMRCTPEGSRILHMGPKLALSIMSATMELERLVAAQGPDTDNDVPMADSSSPSLSASWVVVGGSDNQDWEMVDCGA